MKNYLVGAAFTAVFDLFTYQHIAPDYEIRKKNRGRNASVFDYIKLLHAKFNLSVIK